MKIKQLEPGKLKQFIDELTEAWDHNYGTMSYSGAINGEPEEWSLELSTGGWSHNEDIIEDLQKYNFFWFIYWQKSERGGHYCFGPGEK